MIKLLDRIKRRLWCRWRHDWREDGYSMRTLHRHGIDPIGHWVRKSCLSCMGEWPRAGR